MKTIPREFDKDITIQEAFFYGFFVLLSLTKGLGFYEGQKVFILLTAIALLLGFVKLLVTPYTKGQAVTMVLLLGLTAVVYVSSREIAILFVAFTVLGMKGISVKRTFHIALWVWALCAVVLSVFSFFRLEHTVYRVHDKMGLGHIFRWSLGFTHPNILHITYLMLCALIIWECGKGYGFKQYAVLMLGNILVFFYSVSYTGFGIVAVLLTGCLYVKFRPRFCLLEKILANLVLPVCLVLSFVLPFYLQSYHWLSPYIQQLNFKLNTRIWLAEQFLKSGKYDSLFGRDISRIVGPSMTLDNSYVWCYINFGLVFTVVILAGYFALLFYDTHKQRTGELVILVCFLAAGWTEQLLFNTSFKNITLIFLGAFLFSRKEGEKEYCLFPQFCKRMVTVPLAGLPDGLFFAVRAACRAHKGRILGALAAGAVLGALLCGFFCREPEGYVVPRSYTDGMMEDMIYLESEDDPAYEGWKVMNYVDGDTPMQAVTGRAVKLETVRYYVGSILIGGLFGALAGTAWLLFRAGGVRAVSEISGYDS